MSEIWTQVRCHDLIKQQQVILIPANSSIEDGCQILVQNAISSAPIYDKEKNVYLGMLDYRDIVDYVLIVFRRKQMPTIDEDVNVNITELVRQAMSGQDTPAKFCADLSRRNPFYSLINEIPLSAAIPILSAGTGVHRICLLDQGNISGILSQTDVVRYLMRQTVNDPFVKKTLLQLGLGQVSPYTVNSDSPVLNAMALMSEKGLSSVAVVDGMDYLIGNISMTDIKYIFKHSRFSRLWMSCSQFISMVLTQQGLENEGKDRFPVFEVNSSSTLSYTVNKMFVTKVHRIWVVGDDKKICGVVSLTDIIRAFVAHFPLPRIE